MKTQQNDSVPLWPPAGMVEIEAMLNPDSEPDQSVALFVARRLDRQFDRVRPILRWVEWLEAMRDMPADRSEAQLPIAEPTVVRTVYQDRGAERGIHDETVSAGQLHNLVLDPNALRLLIELKSCSEPEVLEAVGNALEAALCLHPAGESEDGFQPTPLLVPGDKTETDLAKNGDAGMQQEVHCRVRDALFGLLDAVGVRIEDASEGYKATELLRVLAGREAIQRFQQLDRWVHDVRKDYERNDRDAGDVRLICGFVPELLERTEAGAYRHQPAYRLWLRGRLQEFCEEFFCGAEDWQGYDQQQRKLRSAVAELSRARIGEIMRGALDDLEELDEESTRQLSALGIARESLATAKNLLAAP